MSHSVKVEELLPGEIVSFSDLSATFVQRAPHPLYPGLALVVWRLSNGGWSHDALSFKQVVGEVEPSSPEERTNNLRRALLHRSQW